MYDRPSPVQEPPKSRRRVAVVGSGVSGLSAAWLLSQAHDVTLYESGDRLGGHACTIDVPMKDGVMPVDTGFIVFNEPNYPNFTALLDYLDVPSKAAHMSFAVSMDGGGFEYSSHGAKGLFAQKRNLFSPAFWRMLIDLKRFHRTAEADLGDLDVSLCSLGDYLDKGGYGAAFRDRHLLPQAAAIWSSSSCQMADYPAAAFIRFYRNHRLLEVDLKPNWKTVDTGSRAYVDALAREFRGALSVGDPVARIVRRSGRTIVHTTSGKQEVYDAVVLATHSDQALALLDQPTAEETRLLGAIRYGSNRVVMHRDTALMPKRRAAWAAWNYVGGEASRRGTGHPSVTYWMNLLQGLPGDPVFVTLNPEVEPDPATIIADHDFDHPIFNGAALAAQQELWSLQGVNDTWFAGAWFGSGFHEDGLQAGLAVAEAIGGVRRPWNVENESGRIPLTAAAVTTGSEAAPA
ncbi:NAD(P)/FAD-dependent oxidoreductase [Brevundimonas goettingensis]|uniref:FAD-dependent oxidoreductase n=1 Tax=Brevundimonas goettingensis TaxID=2774190 RepID=A0A975C2G9_9CAUL|nr:FAD-dependent oxidoreductase [Brevundimonas goettingensis]